MALSVMPVFAEDVKSPEPSKKANYNITVVPTDGGTATYTYDTEVGEDGFQTVTITALPDDGYEFIGWSIDGADPRGGDPTDPTLTFKIADDITVVPKFKKTTNPSEPTQNTTKKPVVKPTNPGKHIDNGSKSPQTGSGDVVSFAALSFIALAMVSAVVIARKTSKK